MVEIRNINTRRRHSYLQKSSASRKNLITTAMNQVCQVETHLWLGCKDWSESWRHSRMERNKVSAMVKERFRGLSLLEAFQCCPTWWTVKLVCTTRYADRHYRSIGQCRSVGLTGWCGNWHWKIHWWLGINTNLCWKEAVWHHMECWLLCICLMF